MRHFRLITILYLTMFAMTVATVPASARIDTQAEHGILIDSKTGQVLWAKDAFKPMPPASMSKLMTLDLLFQRLADGRVKLTDTFPVSEEAWRTGGSKMFVMVGKSIPVEDLIRGIIIQSGNDACVVVAEALGGTVKGFVDMMNARAKELGLKNSHFVNPDGLPEPPGQRMSARDLAVLAQNIITVFPQYYHYFSEKDFTWNNIHQPNRNFVLEKFPGADGLKTGHTDAAGYGIVASAKRDGQRYILVLNGLRYGPDVNSWRAEQLRADEAARVLGVAFREFKSYDLFKSDDVVGQAKVWQGDRDTVPLVTAAPLHVTMQVDSHAKMKVKFTYGGPVAAPVTKGQKIGALSITAPDFPGMTVPLYAAESVGKAGFFARIFLGLRSLVTGSDTGT